MNMKIPRLMAFDLDGTLAESKSPMSAETGELLAQLFRRMPVAVLSGGSWKQFQHQFLAHLPAGAELSRLYLLPTNAAMCFVYRSGTWHPQYDNSFTDAQKERIRTALAESLAESHFVQPEKVWGEQLEDRGGEMTFSALGQSAPLEEKEGYDPDKKKRTPLFEALTKRLPNFEVAMNAHTSIDITPHGIDKAYGIHRLSELTHIAPKDILYVGDALEEGGNDAAVLRTGVATHAVFSPKETATLIRTVLQSRV